MSYRNPRFSYRHMLRDFGADGIDAVDTDAIASGDLAFLFDERSGAITKWLGTALKELHIFKNAVVNGAGTTLSIGDLNRVIIPKGHNLQGIRPLQLQLFQTLADSGTPTPNLQDGVFYKYYAPSSNIVDWHLEDGDTFIQAALLLLTLWKGLAGSADSGPGELWWTNTVSTSTGIAHRWEDSTASLFDRHELRSGARFAQKRGPSRRVFSLLHRNLSGADLKVYDDLFSFCGEGIHPFWYEGPDSGSAENIFYQWDDITGVVASNGSVLTTPSSRPDGESGQIAQLVDGSQVQISLDIPITAILQTDLVDWHDSVLRCQIKLDWDSTAPGDVQFYVESDVGGSNTARTIYDVGGMFADGVDEEWTRLEIDLEEDATSFTGQGPADLQTVKSFGFIVDRPLTTDKLFLGDFVLLTNRDRPKLVEITRYNRFQDSPAPLSASGPSFAIQMSLQEVTT